MKTYLTFIIFAAFSNMTFGQKVYRADREVYKTNNFVYEFYLLDDSTCYLEGHYMDNAIYFLYKGQLKKTNDSLYEYKFKPIVSFECDKRFVNTDTIRFKITQKDTIISSLDFKVKSNNGLETSHELKIGMTSILVNGASIGEFTVNTKFTDPLTQKLIYLTVDTLSEPDLTYYGVNTAFSTIQISIVKDKLTIYPDHKFIHDIDTFIWIR